MLRRRDVTSFATDELRNALPRSSRTYTPFFTSAEVRPVGLPSIQYVRKIIFEDEAPQDPMPRAALLSQRSDVGYLDTLGMMCAAVQLALSCGQPLALHWCHDSTTVIPLLTTPWPRPLEIVMPLKESTRFLGFSPLHGNKCTFHGNLSSLREAVHVAPNWLLARSSLVVSCCVDIFSSLIEAKVPLKHYSYNETTGKVAVQLKRVTGKEKIIMIDLSTPPSIPSGHARSIRLRHGSKLYDFEPSVRSVDPLPTRVVIRQPYYVQAFRLPDPIFSGSVAARLPFISVVAGLLNYLLTTNAVDTNHLNNDVVYLVPLLGDTYLYYTAGHVSVIERSLTRIRTTVFKSTYFGPPLVCATDVKGNVSFPIAEIGPFGIMPLTPTMLMGKFQSANAWHSVVRLNSERGAQLLEMGFDTTHALLRGDFMPFLSSDKTPWLRLHSLIMRHHITFNAPRVIAPSEYEDTLASLKDLSKQQDKASHLVNFLRMMACVNEDPTLKTISFPPTKVRPPRKITMDSNVRNVSVKNLFTDSDYEDDSDDPSDKRMKIDTKNVAEDEHEAPPEPGYGASYDSPGYGAASDRDPDSPCYSPPSPNYSPSQPEEVSLQHAAEEVPNSPNYGPNDIDIPHSPDYGPTDFEEYLQSARPSPVQEQEQPQQTVQGKRSHDEIITFEELQDWYKLAHE